ncbi:glucose-6-phosphatase 2 [Aplysia californica]|uniref:glucose-6-phosphatase n=1 Tax=Aplysia californica TaxID=6500 RepID=A0ABM0JIK9_APLCA|nr:glucose-6-phosphatase 2 [Aplysia californica]
MQGLSDSIHIWGVGVIQQTQRTFQGQSQLMLLLSHFGDPRFAFTLYFPAAYYLHRSIGVRVLWVAAISEWLNAVCKWILCGERPYWWVHECGLYAEGEVPQLNQYSITCETGPGSPSGHAMITSAVWYILVSDLIHYKEVQSVLFKCVLWSVYGLMMSAVCVSRLFIATHFPHQVIAGVLVGIILAKLFNSVSTSAMTLRTYLVASTVLSAVAVLTYCLVFAFGLDPFWSVSLALKRCALRDWVHLDTTLFYSLIRDISSLLGLGFGLWLDKRLTGNGKSPFRPLVHLPLALAVTLASESLKFPQDNMMLFYALGFLKHFFVVCVVVAGVSRVNL